jgi:hypothetical protein
MPVVTFLRDFRGVATAEQFYERGTVVELPSYLAHLCLAEGVVSVPEVPAVETGVDVPSSTSTPVVTPAPAKRPATKRAAKKVSRGAD